MLSSMDAPVHAGRGPEVFDLDPLELAILFSDELPISGEGLYDAHQLLNFLTLKAVEHTLTRKILAQSSHIHNEAVGTWREEGPWLH